MEYKIQDITLDSIADAINEKTGEIAQMTPAEMVEKIGDIPTPKPEQSKTATENGITVVPDAGMALSSVSVAIPEWAGDIYVLPQIGGRIFYDDGDNGATYTFYDAHDNEITYDGTIASLANATKYAISGTPTKDRFYVYDNSSRTDPYSGYWVANGLLSHGEQGDVYWGFHNTTTSASGRAIGTGKTNTNLILNNFGVPADYTPNVWGYIKRMRDDIYLGCNDWYIGSTDEQDKLKESNLVNWYNEYVSSPWSSSEYNSQFAYFFTNYPAYGYNGWYAESYGKDTKDSVCFAMRSF